MNRILIPSVLFSLLLVGCVSERYQINPPNSKRTDPQQEEPQIVESETDEYMRIVGDLRWDELTSPNEWISRFPDCLTQKVDWSNTLSSKTEEIIIPGEMTRTVIQRCENFTAGGIPISPAVIDFGDNSGTKSGLMTTSVRFNFFDDSQGRAFRSAISQKYTLTVEGKYCSKYTCWNVESMDATPTPYTVSLLDKVKIDTSDL